MRGLTNHRLIVACLSVFLGWAAVGAGQLEAIYGRATPRHLVADANPGSPTTKARQDTRTVQVPGLQAPADAPAAGNPVVIVSTTLGDIKLELFKTRAPVSVENFLR
jgi:hypothetical protein